MTNKTQFHPTKEQEEELAAKLCDPASVAKLINFAYNEYSSFCFQIGMSSIANWEDFVDSIEQYEAKHE